MAQGPGAPCGIEEEVQGGQVTLHGVVSGQAGETGRYRLQVAKLDMSGTSNIVQAGEFRLEPTGRARVGQVGISIGPGGRYDATLALELDGRTLECKASGPSTTRL